MEGTTIKAENKPTWPTTGGEGVHCSMDPVSFPLSKLEEMPTSLGSYRSILPQCCTSEPGTPADEQLVPEALNLSLPTAEAEHIQTKGNWDNSVLGDLMLAA